jgi:hypothetical protein
MSLTYADILRSARDASAFFDATRIPGGPAVRMASDIQRDLVAKAAKRDPELLATTTTLTGATVVAALGSSGVPPTAVTLPAFYQIVRIQSLTSSTQPSTLIAILPEEAHDYQSDRAWFTVGAQVYFTGYSADWTDVVSAIVTYIPAVSDLAAETDGLVVPDGAKWAMTARLAFAFAMRVNGMPTATESPGSAPVQLDISAFSAQASQAESAWLAQLSDQRRKMARNPIRES